MSVLLLKTPGAIQPSGQVEINSLNPITRGLCFTWVGGSQKELKTGLLRTTNNTLLSVGPKGKFVDCSTGQTNLEWARQFCVTSDGEGGGDFALCVLANPAASGGGAVEHAFAQKNDAGGSPFAQAALLFNGNTSAVYASGSVAFFTYNTAATGVAVTGLQDGLWHVWWGVRRGTTLELWRDGVLVASNSGTLRNILQSAGRYTAIGSRGNGTTEGYRDGVALAAMFNRAPSAKEIASVSANLWQLFATSRPIWEPAAGGGGQSNAPRYFHRTQSGQA